MPNYLSFFTIESNVLAIAWFSASCYIQDTKNIIYNPIIRGAILNYMIVTMIVFFALLTGQFSNINFINSYGLHLIMPIAYILDWFIKKPKSKIETKSAFYWLIYPIIYLAYALIRGRITNWYPYLFLTPENGSYLNVAKYSVGLLIFFMLIILIIYFLNNKLAKSAK